MNINVTVSVNYPGLAEKLDLILANQGIIMSNQAEVAQQLRDMTAQNEKARQENLTKLAALQAAIDAAGNSTPEVDAALAELKASIQMDDDENLDQVAARKAAAAGGNTPQGTLRR